MNNKDNRKIYKVNNNTFNAKVDLDKYYTPIDIARYCIDKTYEIIGKENITEIIEPSAGSGSFSLQIPNCIAYDIKPEHESIIEQDFFQLKMEYKKGRLFIGNPPYGKGGKIELKFFKHCIKYGDYIAFILPASQYNNIYSHYEFDLIHSEIINSNGFVDLNKDVNLCFNIYKKPNEGLNKRKKYEFEDFNLYLLERRNGKDYKDKDYCFRISTWGSSTSRILKDDEFYAKEVAFYIYNKDIEKELKELFENNKIKEEYYMSSTPNLSLWQIYEYILKYIPNIK